MLIWQANKQRRHVAQKTTMERKSLKSMVDSHLRALVVALLHLAILIENKFPIIKYQYVYSMHSMKNKMLEDFAKLANPKIST